MFGVRGKDAGSGPRRTLHEKVTGADQAFLIGKRNGCTAIYGGECRFQTSRSADRRHDPIRRAYGGLNDSAFASAAFRARTGQRIL